MATTILSTAYTFLASTLSFSPISSVISSSLAIPTFVCFQNRNAKIPLTLCKALSEPPQSTSPILTKRSLSICLVTSFVFSLVGKDCSSSNAAILEADDDEELLERLKGIERRGLKDGVISSAKKETGYLQELGYRLSKVGQAIEINDFPTASSVLGSSTETDWVQKANIALNKLSSSLEEKTEVDTFNSSLVSLIASENSPISDWKINIYAVTRNDVQSTKLAFASSANAIEKWTSLTGLIDQLKGQIKQTRR